MELENNVNYVKIILENMVIYLNNHNKLYFEECFNNIIDSLDLTNIKLFEENIKNSINSFQKKKV